jgi:predicted RNase H-like HicB family nuclease
MSDIQEYTVTVHEEADSLWAEVDELPGCFATGDNLDELREALEEAISLYLHDAPNRGRIRSMEKVDEERERHMEVGSMRVRVPA